MLILHAYFPTQSRLSQAELNYLTISDDLRCLNYLSPVEELTQPLNHSTTQLLN